MVVDRIALEGEPMIKMDMVATQGQTVDATGTDVDASTAKTAGKQTRTAGLRDKRHKRDEGACDSLPHTSPSAAWPRSAFDTSYSAATSIPIRDADVREVHLAFSLSAGKQLAADVATRHPTVVNLRVTPNGLSLHTSSPLAIDAQFPFCNMLLSGASYVFGDTEATVDLSVARDGFGFVDVSGRARSEVSALIMKAIAGTPLLKRGYNPLDDPGVIKVLTAIADNFTATPSARDSTVALSELRQVAAGGTFVVRSPIDVQEGDGGIRVPAGGAIAFTVQGAGSVGDVAGAGSLPGAVAAANVSTISIVSEAITLLSDDKPIASLQEVTIGRGGTVTVNRATALGSLETLAGIESLVRLFADAAAYSRAGLGDDAALELAARNADATMIPARARARIERTLTIAFQRLVRENATAIPGVDLARALGIEEAPAR